MNLSVVCHRWPALLALSCVLAACQSTSFEMPPLAASACDPALAGHWISIDDAGKPDGEMALDLSADCQLDVTDRSNGKLRRGEPTLAHVGRVGDDSYIWVDAGWAAQRFDFKDLGVVSSDIYLMRYRFDQGDLLFNDIDDKAVAHLIVDGKIPGKTVVEDDKVVNRVTGPARPDVLALPGVFNVESLRFRRDAGGVKP